MTEVLARPAFQWREESDAATTLRRWWRELKEWLDQLSGGHPELFRALIWALVLVLAAVAVHSIWLLVKTTRARPVSSGSGATGRAEVRDAEWYRAEAERLFHAGRFSAALQAQFIRLVLELDRREVVRFHPSRTPREYLLDLPEGDTRRRDLAALIGDLYRYAFSGAGCGPAEYQAWTRAATIDRYVAPR